MIQENWSNDTSMIHQFIISNDSGNPMILNVQS